MEELLKLQHKIIKITNDKCVNILEQTLFQNGNEGLHLWEASIVLSRYIAKYKNLLENKKIIELGTGCGLIGICALLYTQCKHFVFSDYQESVLVNLLNNIKYNIKEHIHSEELNDLNCLGCNPGRYSLLKLDWKEYENFINHEYDVILGSELVYSGGCIEELVKLIYNLLSRGNIIKNRWNCLYYNA